MGVEVARAVLAAEVRPARRALPRARVSLAAARERGAPESPAKLVKRVKQGKQGRVVKLAKLGRRVRAARRVAAIVTPGTRAAAITARISQSPRVIAARARATASEALAALEPANLWCCSTASRT
jgi:predicted deacylase